MTPLTRGLIIAAVHCGIVLSLAGKYALDRERLPRVWAKPVPVDPKLPLRGRYIQLRLEAACRGVRSPYQDVRLAIDANRLVAEPSPGAGVRVFPREGGQCRLIEPVAFFIPEHVPDPSLVKLGEELWVEVSVPNNGPPRPIRLGIKKDGVLTPLALN